MKTLTIIEKKTDWGGIISDAVCGSLLTGAVLFLIMVGVAIAMEGYFPGFQCYRFYVSGTFTIIMAMFIAAILSDRQKDVEKTIRIKEKKDGK